MYATDLAHILRGAGLDVVEVDGWQHRGHGPLTSVDGIVDHHTAGPATGDYPSLRTVVDGRPGLTGPLCNLGVGRSGRVWVVAAGLAYHAGAVLRPSFANGRRLGIEVEATGRDGVPGDWPAVQLDAMVTANAALAIAYHFPAAECLGHKEVCSPVGRKIDPHPVDMAAFRMRVDRRIAELLDVSRGGPRPPVDTTRPTIAQGTRGTAVRTLQTRLHELAWRDGPVDGVFDADVARAVLGLQVAAGLVPDRVVGPRTYAALDGGQRPRFTTRGLVQVGDRGDDVRDVQTALVRNGIRVGVDGVFGVETRGGVRRRQVQLDLDVDGVVGPDTAAALGGRSV